MGVRGLWGNGFGWGVAAWNPSFGPPAFRIGSCAPIQPPDGTYFSLRTFNCDIARGFEIMRHALLFIGAASLALAGAAVAKPGNGHGNGHGYDYGDEGHGHGHGYGRDGPVGYGVGGCPPGLAKKHNGCMPPGQAKKLYRGERFPYGYGTSYGYRQIPYDLRSRYGLSPNDRYYYSGGYLYRVDPRTMLVEQVISALLR